MKKLFITACIIFIVFISFAQSKQAGTEREAIKKFMSRKEIPAVLPNKNVDEIKHVLKQYNNAVGKLDVTETEKFFASDSQIYESGNREGSYAHYMVHHLTPELKEFQSFSYGNYKVDVVVDGNYAFTNESYNYTIIMAKDNTEVKRKGVATSVLKKGNGEWKIMLSHISSRK